MTSWSRLAPTEQREWNLASGAQIAKLTRQRAHITAMAASPDGEVIAIGDNSGVAALWRLRAAALTGELVHGSQVTAIAWSPDGRLVATLEAAMSTLHVWDIGAKREIWKTGRPSP